jgi:hypothetical protein
MMTNAERRQVRKSLMFVSTYGGGRVRLSREWADHLAALVAADIEAHTLRWGLSNDGATNSLYASISDEPQSWVQEQPGGGWKVWWAGSYSELTFATLEAADAWAASQAVEAGFEVEAP